MDKFKEWSIKEFFKKSIREKFTKDYVKDMSISRIATEVEEHFKTLYGRIFDAEERDWICKRIENCIAIDSWKPHLRILSKEELLKHHRYTFKDLKKFINDHNISEDAMIVVERVEDYYYEYNSWGVILKEGEQYWNCIKWNEDIENGVYLDKVNYPNMDPKTLKMIPEEDIEKSKDQYHPIFCAVQFEKGENDVIYLNLHY